jgi:cytochrome c-type biogenesis protein CcmH/NrfG
MDNNDNIIMSRIAFERMQAKDERNDRFRNITILVLIILLVVTNAMWLVAWNQYDYVDAEDAYSIEAQQDGEGINIVGGGDIDYGANSNDNTQETNQIEDAQ